MVEVGEALYSLKKNDEVVLDEIDVTRCWNYLFDIDGAALGNTSRDISPVGLDTSFVGDGMSLRMRGYLLGMSMHIFLESIFKNAIKINENDQMQLEVYFHPYDIMNRLGFQNPVVFDWVDTKLDALLSCKIDLINLDYNGEYDNTTIVSHILTYIMKIDDPEYPEATTYAVIFEREFNMFFGSYLRSISNKDIVKKYRRRVSK